MVGSGAGFSVDDSDARGALVLAFGRDNNRLVKMLVMESNIIIFTC
jgi:hypothetical protein